MHITANKNTPGETRSPFVTTRGMGVAEMKVIADCIADCIWHYDEKKDELAAICFIGASDRVQRSTPPVFSSPVALCGQSLNRCDSVYIKLHRRLLMPSSSPTAARVAFSASSMRSFCSSSRSRLQRQP